MRRAHTEYSDSGARYDNNGIRIEDSVPSLIRCATSPETQRQRFTRSQRELHLHGLLPLRYQKRLIPDDMRSVLSEAETMFIVDDKSVRDDLTVADTTTTQMMTPKSVNGDGYDFDNVTVDDESNDKNLGHRLTRIDSDLSYSASAATYDQDLRCSAALVVDGMKALVTEHRFEAQPLRVWSFMHRKGYIRLRLFVATAHLLLALIEQPSQWNVSYVVPSVLEFMCLLYYTVDLGAMWYALGRLYMRHRIRLSIILVILIDLLTGLAFQRSSELSRILRPAFLLSFSETLWSSSTLILFSMKKGAALILMITFVIVFYAFFGFLVFGDVPNNPFFETLPQSMMSLTVLLTTANFPDVMLPAYQVSKYSALYFASYLLLALYFLSNLVLASVYNGFQAYTRNDVKERLYRVEIGLDKAYGILTKDREGVDMTTWVRLCGVVRPKLPAKVATLIFLALDSNADAMLGREEFFGLVRYLNAAVYVQDKELTWTRTFERLALRYRFNWDRCMGVRSRTRELITAKVTVCRGFYHIVIFEAFMDFIVIANCVLLYFETVNNSKTYQRLNDVCLGLYVIEMFVKMLAFGPIDYWSDGVRRLDGSLTIVTLFSEIITRATSLQARSLQALRVLRLLRLLGAIRAFRVVLNTLHQVLSSHAIGLVSILCLLMYMYAIIGMKIFKGGFTRAKLAGTEYDRLDYYALNYDSLQSSFVCLLMLAIVNQWAVLMDAAVVVVGSEWIRLYFISFYVASVMIVANVMIAFLLDSFFFFQAMPMSDESEEVKKLPSAQIVMQRVLDSQEDENQVTVKEKRNIVVAMFGGEKAEKFENIDFDG